MITVGDFLKSFVKYANETPNALVYTDLAPWESGNISYCYVKSLMLKDGAVLLDCINEDFIDKDCCLNAETILKLLQQQDPSLQLLVDCGGESSIFDGIQYRGQFDAYSEAGNALLESAVIDPCLDEYWELNEKGAYTAEWTENEVREFKEKMKARWSYVMEIAYRAMNGTLDENPGKTLDEAEERDFKIMCLLCGKTTAQDVPAPADDNNSFPDLPF